MFVVAMLPPLSPVSRLATPSIVMLFELGRWPLKVKLLTVPASDPPIIPPVGSAPGTSDAKLKSARRAPACRRRICRERHGDAGYAIVRLVPWEDPNPVSSMEPKMEATHVAASRWRGPRYAQITRALCGLIQNGVLPPGTRVPPTRELARDLACSRNLVLLAYEQLILEGYLT